MDPTTATDPLAAMDPSAVDPSTLIPMLMQLFPMKNTFGAYLIGTIFGFLLFGIYVNQMYRYIRLFRTDHLSIRILVISVGIGQTIHTGMTCHSSYHYLVSHPADIEVLSQGVWSLNFIPLVIGIIMFLAQLFFARRVILMGDVYRLMAIVAMFFFVVELGLAIVAIYTVVNTPALDHIKDVNYWLGGSFAAALVGDALITGSLIVAIRRSRIIEVRTAESFIEVLTVYIVNTGLLHGVVNIVSMVLAFVFPSYLLHGATSTVATRLYGNTLMAVLNSRKLHYGRDVQCPESSAVGRNFITHANRLATAERWNIPQVPDSSPKVININVMTETEGHGEKGASDPSGSKGPTREGKRFTLRSLVKEISMV